MDKTTILSMAMPHKIISPFMAKHAQLYAPQPLPKEYRRGNKKECFLNAFVMAVTHNLTYVEGYAVLLGIPLAVLHAWCIDDVGVVLDNSWKPVGVGYLGVPFDTQFIIKTLDERRKRGEEYYGFV